jgi:hypothetical protein
MRPRELRIGLLTLMGLGAPPTGPQRCPSDARTIMFRGTMVQR